MVALAKLTEQPYISSLPLMHDCLPCISFLPDTPLQYGWLEGCRSRHLFDSTVCRVQIKLRLWVDSHTRHLQSTMVF